jgi:hypothetical protein
VAEPWNLFFLDGKQLPRRQTMDESNMHFEHHHPTAIAFAAQHADQ